MVTSGSSGPGPGPHELKYDMNPAGPRMGRLEVGPVPPMPLRGSVPVEVVTEDELDALMQVRRSRLAAAMEDLVMKHDPRDPRAEGAPRMEPTVVAQDAQAFLQMAQEYASLTATAVELNGQCSDGAVPSKVAIAHH